MQRAYVVTGTLSDAQTVALDEPVDLGSTKVRLVIEALEASPLRPYDEVMLEIRRRQAARGHQAPSREEVDESLHADREALDV